MSYIQNIMNQCINRGHFELTSGLHSDTYIQTSQIFKECDIAGAVCWHLLNKICEDNKNIEISKVVSPAIGAILFGYEMARQLSVENIFAEKTTNGFELKRDFTIENDDKILCVENTITTGGSLLKLMESLQIKPVAIACLVNRSGLTELNGVKIYSVLDMPNIVTYSKDDCPLCKESQAVKPGSGPCEPTVLKDQRSCYVPKNEV